QGVDSLFEVDTVRRILDHVCRIANIEYHNNDKNDISIRVITDHIRSTTFMICDGILPSNEGRGYVLRRLLRRAARHGRLLGINRPFLTEICDTVIAENKDAYPELVGRADYIKRVISEEEKRFYNTIEGGMQLLDALFEQMQANGKTVFDGANAFKLYDTYGFPIDLTREIAEEKGYTIDMDTFTALMNKQKETARNARNASTNEGWVTNEAIAVQPATEYLGYDNDTCAANVLAILSGNGTAESAMEDEQVALILDRTVCYAESGGQVGSKGTIRTESGIFTVTGCQKAVGGQYIHSGYVESGMISCGAATCTVDTASAAATRRNHTSVHLLQAALRKVLGDHVHQAGSYVDDSRLRLDFSHFSAVTPEQLVEIENIVNDAIAASLPVETKVMPIEEAKKTGAMALFGEKYGDFVRVVDVKDFSVEFCGGTHIDNTAKIGLFKILYESSVAAGVRRIEAVTGRQILDLIRREQSLIRESGELLKLKNTSELPNKIASMLEDNKAREHAFDKMRSAMAELQASTLYTNIVNICGVSLITTRLDDSDSAMMRELAERLTTATPPKKFVDLVDKKLVIVLGGVCDGKGAFAVACSKDAVAAGLKAGDIAREVAKIAGGNGGGRPDFAMAGAKEINLIDRALNAVDGIISSKLQ
ncbi:MAG: alanine--tRNA ligase, partial [Clostridia bacterium]|nr:alanine--tRNA ligase [Clostridia bacterium]